MFYLGFSDCASAELCLLVFFSFVYLFFFSKKRERFKFTKIRPFDDFASRVGEVEFHDIGFFFETHYSLYRDTVEYSNVYSLCFYDFLYEDEDYIDIWGADDVVERVQYVINKDSNRIELRKFLLNEIIERRYWLYKKYYDPKYQWYS